MSDALQAYRPPLWLPGRHLQTIVPSVVAARPLEGRRETLDVPVAPNATVRCAVDRSPGRTTGTLLLIHGLGGSADAPYIVRTARHALGRGWTTVRMNLRTCGGTGRLSATLCNAGQGDDAGGVLAALDREGFPRPFVAAGFSLGGNLVARYAATSGDACVADAVVGINPPLDLEGCLRALERPGNAIYHLHFVVLLCVQVGRLRRLRPVAGPSAWPWRIRTLRRFDDGFTAPDAGYDSASAYYAAASAGPLLPGIRRPTLILSAENDPFVDVATLEPFRNRSPLARFAHPRGGGHCGYWQSGHPRLWAAAAMLDWVDAALS
ncbi:MAG TPA: alpha/beta fold hydrolase [Candidatus Polarisedimenticolaceae bacterium]